jgi:hypothetical protein
MKNLYLIGLLGACSVTTGDAPSDIDDNVADNTPDVTPVDEGVAEPIDCVGLENYRSFKSPLGKKQERVQLAEFPVSVPNLVQIGDTLWAFAQIFQPYERHCDVIGFAPLDSLPSAEKHPFTPIKISGLPALGNIPSEADIEIPPADVTVVHMEDKGQTVLVTKLLLSDTAQEPCIGVSVANDGLDPSAGFRFLPDALWCEPGVAMMDPGVLYDKESSTLRVVFANFGGGPSAGIENHYAEIDVESDNPDNWSVADSRVLEFNTFSLLGNFSTDTALCDGPVFFGSTNYDKNKSVLAACFDSKTGEFETVPAFEVLDVSDISVGFEADNEEPVMVFSLGL